MGRARKNCPIFRCGSTDFVKLSNHLAQVNGMGIKERVEMCVPRHRGNSTDHDLNIEKTLQQSLKRISDIEA